MKTFTFTLLSFFSTLTYSQEDIRFKRLTCLPPNQSVIVEVTFPKLIHPFKPFIGFPEMWVQVRVQSPKAGLYERNQVLMIPEGNPSGITMRGQSSDALYIRLQPEVINGHYAGRYFGQIFVNDRERIPKAYYRYMGTESSPGLICTDHSDLY